MHIHICYLIKESLAGAIFACFLLRKMANLTNDKDEKYSMIENANFFEKLASELLTECSSTNYDLTMEILLRQVYMLSGRTCLKMAYDCLALKFLTHYSCQNITECIWNGHLLPGHRIFRILIAAIFPPLLLTLNYRGNNEINKLISSERVTALEVRCLLIITFKTISFSHCTYMNNKNPQLFPCSMKSVLGFEYHPV